MKKFMKWMGAAVLIPIVLFSSLAALLYFPPFQRWAVKQASAYASEKTGMDVSVGNVRLRFPLDLSLNEVVAVKCETGDTIANVGSVVADVQLRPLLKKQVVIDELMLENARINTADLIESMRLKGDIGKLRVSNSDVLLNGRDDPSTSDVNLSDVLLADADLDIVFPDSVPEDTTASETAWRILADKIKIKNSGLRITQLPLPDGKNEAAGYALALQFGDANLKNGVFDLKRGIYEVGSADIRKSAAGYNDLQMSSLNLRADSVRFSAENGPDLALNVRSLSVKMDAGFDALNGTQIQDASGKLALADDRLKLRNLTMKTADSEFSTDFEMSLDAFSDVNPGTMKGRVRASLGKHDVMPFIKDLPKDVLKQWPEKQAMEIDGELRGNMKNLYFSNLHLSLPSVFRAKTTGTLQNLDYPERLNANLDLDITTPATKNALQGSLVGTVKYDAAHTAYDAKLKAVRFPMQRFTPGMGLSPLTANIDVRGQGTDILSPRTQLTAKVDIQQFSYSGYDLSGVKGDATLKNGRVGAVIDSQNELLKGTATINALTNKNRFHGTLTTDLSMADLLRLGLTDSVMTVSGCAHLDIDSDLKDDHKIQGNLGDLTLRMHNETFRPDDMWVDVLLNRANTNAVIDCSDFHLDLKAKGHYERLIDTGERLVNEVQRQYGERIINEGRLRSMLPDARLSVRSGSENFIVDLLNRSGYDFKSFNCNVVSSPVEGLNGRMHLESLLVNDMLLDTINFAIKSDSIRTTYQAQVRNNKKNPQYTFNALVDGILQDRGTTFGTRLYDANGDLGVRLGLQATMEDRGLMFRAHVKEPVLGFRKFKVNDENFVFLSHDGRVSADVVLRADDGTGVQIYTNDDNEEAKQDVTVSVNHFDLERILSVIPYTPNVKGMMNGDFHFVQTDNQVTVSSDLGIQNLIYENSPVGNIGTEFVYMPKTDGSHYIDGILKLEGKDIATLNGTYFNKYNEDKKLSGTLDATVELLRTPLSIINGFIPNQIIGFEGYGEGSLAVHGPLSAPIANGEVFLDSAYLVSQPYGVRLRFDNDPVIIKGSKLLFENFEMYANNSSPLTTYGSLDFTNPEHIRLDLRMRAQNFLLIDAKENFRSEAFGKAYVNYFGSINGELTNLNMRGKLDVLGTTDLVYILRDSPLTTDNHLEGLVTFTDFNDTTQTKVARPELGGFTMDMTVDVSKGAHVMAYLNTDKSNYIDLMGGGVLRMNYNTTDNLRLTGRYTLANGQMKYSLPIIPLKTFTIKDGSYLEFTGDVMNPTLNITATERKRAPVTDYTGASRSVEFECGVVITKTLNDMGLEFTLDAPEDMTLFSELQSMSKEQRGKLAVTMLTTGMYLADGNTNAFSMNNALSSFLQNEISNITGNALRTIDLSVGLDNTTDATGRTSTNYSFKFAKRFWNNRLKIAVGGKVTTGAEVPNQDHSFFDNVIFEYRLDDSANKYVTLFYENNVYDWLDGYTQEYGVGFIWRRSLQHIKDIFKKEEKP